MIDPQDKEAIHTIIVGVGILAGALYLFHLGGFRFNVGVSG